MGNDGRLCRTAVGSTRFMELAAGNDLGVDFDLPENVWPTAHWLPSTRWALAVPAGGQWRWTSSRDVPLFGVASGEDHQQDARN